MKIKSNHSPTQTKNIFSSFFHKHHSFLRGCVRPLDTTPSLKTRPPSLLVLHMDFCIVLPSHDSNCQQPSFFHDVIERNGM